MTLTIEEFDFIFILEIDFVLYRKQNQRAIVFMVINTLKSHSNGKIDRLIFS